MKRGEGPADEGKEQRGRQKKVLLIKKGVEMKRGESQALCGRQKKVMLMKKGVEVKRGESKALCGRH